MMLYIFISLLLRKKSAENEEILLHKRRKQNIIFHFEFVWQ